MRQYKLNLVLKRAMQPSRPISSSDVRIVGRYALYGRLATGGMATVHFGRLLGPVGFSRTVAIKRLHPQYAKDPEFVTMFLDEARLAARIQHPNVVATLDVVALEEELLLVMDYIRGDAFSRILRTARKKKLEPPVPFIATIVTGMLHGLHAAHEATDERGQPLRVVHRDVSPQNVLVGVDGVPRLLDFGVAKAASRAQVTRDGQIKGKLSYMSPEQLTGRVVDRRADVFAAAVVLWESLTGKRLFLADEPQEMIRRILDEPVPAPSMVRPGIPPSFDKIVARGLEKDPDARYSTAREFAVALEHSVDLMSAREVGEWVEEIMGDVLELREQALAELESFSSVTDLSPPSGPHVVDFPHLLPSSVPSPGAAMPTRPSGTFSRSASSTHPSPRSNESAVTAVAVPHAAGTPSYPLPVPADDPEGDPFGTARRRRRTLGIVGAAVVGSVVLWLAWPAPVSTVNMQGVTPAPTPAQALSADPQPAPPSAPVHTAPVHMAPAQPAATPTPAEMARPEEPTPPSRLQVRKPRRAAATRAASPATGSQQIPTPPGHCAQPWNVDSEGIRRIKPECL